MTTHGLHVAVGIATASVVLGLASTATLATAGLGNPGGPFVTAPPSCDVPALPGAVVDVTLTDMPGTMMGPSPRGEYSLDAPTQGYPWPRMRMMSLLINPTTVPAGQVSFRVANAGAWIHELTVLSLAPSKSISQRHIEADNQVDESARVDQVEGSYGADKGDGIAPGATVWTTITLALGRYELICNAAGHYRAGMYAQLEVTG